MSPSSLLPGPSVFDAEALRADEGATVEVSVSIVSGPSVETRVATIRSSDRIAADEVSIQARMLYRELLLGRSRG